MTFQTRQKLLRISFALLLVAVLGGFAWFALRPSEPVYQGRTLSSWLEQYAANSQSMPDIPASPESIALCNNSKIAIQQIGTNALPILLRMASAHDSELKSNVMVLAARLLPIHPVKAERYHYMAAFGFFSLGALGKNAMPGLIELLKSPYPDVRSTAADSLGDIGPEAKAAVPFFLPLLNDSNRITRWDAAINLGRIHSQPELVVPRLLQDLNSLNPDLGTTILALGEFGVSAKGAVPSLIPFLSNKDQYIRFRTTNALKQIDPEAAAKLGIK